MNNCLVPYDWARETDLEMCNHTVSSDRVMLLSSVAGSAAFAACEFGMDVSPSVALGIGVVTLFGGAIGIARNAVNNGFEIE